MNENEKAVLKAIHANPGKDASWYVEHADFAPWHLRQMKYYEKYGFVTYKSGGWYLTAKGDIAVAGA
jgi:hypothetical protein